MRENIKKALIIIMAIAALAVTVGGLVTFRQQVVHSYDSSYDKAKYYDRSYALITRDNERTFWDQVYVDMLSSADRSGTFVERLGADLAVPYSETELMEIATASKASGIIVESDGSEEMDAAIMKASENGIPVVTVWTDAPGSERISYVGLSYYNLGCEYGNLIADAAKDIMDSVEPEERKDENYHIKAVLLLDKEVSDSSQNTILLGIQEELNHSSIPAGVLEMKTVGISNESDFSAEEQIHDLFNAPKAPDIVICLNQVNTLSVYQTIVEKNMVGNTLIIGYSDSDTILKAIEKKSIYATIIVDSTQMAEYCVSALNDYLDFGRTSDYYSVDFSCIDFKNVEEYEREKNETE